MITHHVSTLRQGFRKQALARKQKGFTLVEVVVGVFIASVLMGGVIGLYAAMTRSVKAGREQTIIQSLTSNYLEIVRNLPYIDVGTLSGNPGGSLADQANPIQATIQGVIYKIYYEVTYIDDPADGTILLGTDFAPNDYKQVKMFIENTTTTVVRSFITSITPKGLEETNNAGALLIKVFDATGQPIPSASVHIENIALTIVLNRTSDAAGNWIEVGLPAAVNDYHVVVTKSGYSTGQTYPISVGNPNPIKPDATIVVGQVTQISFSIDLLSNLTVRTLDSFCAPISGIGVNIAGAKLIGTNPNVLKFNNNYTSAAGQIVLANIEWDTYTPTLLTGQGYLILGTSPIQQITVLPNSSATYTMILGTQTTHSLLIIVKNSATGTALEGASVNLHKGGSTPQDYDAITGGSIWEQSDWTNGSGQANFVNPDQYFSDDGNVDINSVPTGLRLKKISGDYVLSGQLISSSFDTGAASNFTTITWEPTSQHPSTTLRFQIASNNDNATWNYLGPDGTASTYYTVPGSNIATVHDNDRYVRYKASLNTTDDKHTPILTSIGINYVSGCFTPGQVSFDNLTSGNNYDLTVSMSGYQTVVLNSLNINGNQSIEVVMSP